MSRNAIAKSPGRLATLAAFIQDVYAPALHIGFAAAWFLALDGGFAVLSGNAAWRVRHLAVGVATYFLVLFYLRVLDEWKDLDYDRIHNPDRPLVRGAVTLTDIYWFLAASAAVVLALQWLLPAFSGGSRWPLAIIALDLGYGILLVGIERISGAVKDNIFLNLVFTYPVNVALSIYAYAAYLGRTGAGIETKPVLLIAGFALAFLHYEFARKTSWPRQAKAGKRLYSSAMGPQAALVITVFFAVAAVAIAVGLFAPLGLAGLAPLLALLPVVAAARRFLAVRHLTSGVKPSAPMTPFAMIFITLYYIAIALVAIVHGVSL